MTAERRFIIVGGDSLALRVCAELAPGAGRRVAIVWEARGDLAARVERCGASFVALSGDERESLLAAGVLEASVIIALTEDDHTNLHYVLTARDLNPQIRVVLRQFNRTLGRKIEQNLADSAVVSLSSHVAATYAAVAADPAYYYGVQFPDIDGPLAGFRRVAAASAGVAGLQVAAAEERLGARIVAVAGETGFDRARSLEGHDELTLFARVRVRTPAPDRAHKRRAWSPHETLAALRKLDPVVQGAFAAAVIVFASGAAFFANALHLDPLTAAYFATTTMTTTGYGDISPLGAGAAGRVGAMLLMLSGLVFSGIFIALLSSMFTQARYDAVQGLRRIRHGGHYVVCGSGNVGSRVVEFLVRLDCRLVVIESQPRPEVVEGSRERRYELLTGDATKDATLDLCNIEGAVGLVALTNSDTTNLEVALGARARKPALPIVMRVQQGTFEKSVRTQFGIDRTYGTAAIMAPVLAGLALSPGVRGRVEIGTGNRGIVERISDGANVPGAVPLAVWRDGAFELLGRFEDATAGERVLLLEASLA